MTAMNVIRGIVTLTYLLIISPALIGVLLCHRMDEKMMNEKMFRYLVGFFSQLGIWGFLALPWVLWLNEKLCFHFLCKLFLIILLIVSIFGLIISLRRQGTQKENITRCFRNAAEKYDLWQIVIAVAMMLIICYQLFCAIYSIRTDAYGDNYFYTGDSVRTLLFDRIYTESDGAKSVLAPWRSYWPFLAYIIGQHPLFINDTILPVIILFLFYMSTYVFSRYLFLDDDREQSLFFLMLSVLVLFFERYSFSSEALMMHPLIWGKGILGGAGLPLIVICYNCCVDNSENNRIPRIILLMFLSAGVSWLTMMSLPILPLTVGIISLVRCVKERKIVVWVYAIPTMIGAFLQGAIYLLLYKIGAA